MKSIGKTNIGLVRKTNEDRLLIEDEVGLFVVCDGMGGHKGGDVASTLAVQAVKGCLPEFDPSAPINWLNQCIRTANESIRQCSQSNSELSDMGTTITAALIQNKQLYAANVGDSRLYSIRNGIIRKITKDHTLAEQMLADGLLKADDLASSAYNHILTRALGTEDSVIIDNFTEQLEDDDIILICTDGLSDMLNDEEIASVIRKNGNDMDRAASELIENAIDNGGFDNITIILIRV